MAILTDTATDHSDLFDQLRAFLTGDAGWTELRYSSGSKRALYVAPGLSGTEQIHVGISLHADDGADAFALGLWMFRSYASGLDDLSQPGHSGVTYVTLWDDSLPFWFVANAQRLVVVAKTSTVYAAGYVGKFLPYGTPGEYGQPYFVGGNVAAATTRWSDTSPNTRNFFDPGEGARLLLPNGEWVSACNFFDQTGESQRSNSAYVWPYAAGLGDSASAKSRWRELRNNIDGSYALRPLVLLSESPVEDLYGELDGVFACSGFSAGSEDTVDVGGDDHLLVQNVFRTERYNYAAVRLT